MFPLISERSPAKSPQLPIGSRIAASLILAIFLAFGVMFLFLVGREGYRTIQTWHWLTVPCVIESSSVISRSNGYQFQIAYHYDIAATRYHSTHFATTTTSSSDYASQQRLAMQYPAGAAAHCFVNPDNPSDSIIRQGDLWILAFALIPLLFVAIGGGGIYAVWFLTPPSGLSVVPTRRRRKANPKFLFSLFAVIGGVMFCLVSVRVMLNIAAARNWITVPCVIKSSRVQSHSGDKGTTYSIDILYAYIQNGREFRSNRYGFMGGSSSGYDGKAAIVHTFRPGMHAICYVNPDDPTDAVLNRGFTSDMLFGLIPLAFFAIGVLGLISQFRKRRLQST